MSNTVAPPTPARLLKAEEKIAALQAEAIQPPPAIPQPGKKRRRGAPPERLAAVDQLLRRCVPHWTIERELSSKWNISATVVRRYIQEVYAQWAVFAKMRNKETEYEQIRLSIQDVVAKAFAKSELKTALFALDRLARLGGHFVERIEVQGQMQHNYVRLNPGDEDRIRARIAELSSAVQSGQKFLGNSPSHSIIDTTEVDASQQSR